MRGGVPAPRRFRRIGPGGRYSSGSTRRPTAQEGNMRDRVRRPRLRTFLATGLALSAAGSIARAQAAPTTDWTGAAGDHLWGNPANWSNGAPDANTGATFYRDFMWETIDLGGVTRNAESVRTGAGI